MLEDAGGGTTKLRAATTAAIRFVEFLDVVADRVGLVRFSATSEVVAPLSLDHQAVKDGLLQLESSPGTRVDAGLATVHDMLTKTARPGVSRAVVLLADGHQDEERHLATAAAERLKQDGIVLYAIAFGTGADITLMTDLASSPQHVFISPRPRHLAAIFHEISNALRCD
jgi:hypothetical protein